MDIFQELDKQEEAIRTNGYTPKYVSFSLSGFRELLKWAHSQAYGPTELMVSNVSLLCGYPILVNPQQRDLVIVLVDAMNEFLHYDEKDKIRASRRKKMDEEKLIVIEQDFISTGLARCDPQQMGDIFRISSGRTAAPGLIDFFVDGCDTGIDDVLSIIKDKLAGFDYERGKKYTIKIVEI